MSMPSRKPILLVEDDCVDVIIVRRALRELGITTSLVCTCNGEEALSYLADKSHLMPCVILLDLNMPRMDGFEFLRIVKADETVRDIPVVVVTTSSNTHDMAETLQQGAVGYVVKSADYGVFRETMKVIQSYAAPVEQSGELDMARL
jgi:CheY-like chemotaxis protein